MTTIGGGDAAVLFAVASLPVPEDAAPRAAPGVAPAAASNVVKGSCCSLGSGFPRRRRGRFGSLIGASSESDADGAAAFGGSGEGAGLLAGGAAGALAAGVADVGFVVGGDFEVVAGCGGFVLSLFLSLSLSLSVSELLPESAGWRRCSTGGPFLSSSAMTGVEYFLRLSFNRSPAGVQAPSAIQTWFSWPGWIIVKMPSETPLRNAS